MRIASLTALLALTIAVPAAAEPDWKTVAQALGKEGSLQAGGVYRVGLPRTDLNSERIAALDAKIAEMQGARDALSRLARDCGAGSVGPCPIITAFEQQWSE